MMYIYKYHTLNITSCIEGTFKKTLVHNVLYILYTIKYIFLDIMYVYIQHINICSRNNILNQVTCIQ